MSYYYRFIQHLMIFVQGYSDIAVSFFFSKNFFRFIANIRHNKNGSRFDFESKISIIICYSTIGTVAFFYDIRPN